MFHKPPSILPSVDRIEHLQTIAELPEDEWLDLLQMTWRDYRHFLLGQRRLPEISAREIQKFFDIPHVDLTKEDPNFEDLALRFHRIPKELPEEFLVGAHGRRRTSITSLEFIKLKHGWRLHRDVLKTLNVDPSAMKDPFAPISMKFITDVTSYLAKREFHLIDFFQMGRYSRQANQNSVVGQILSSCPTPNEAYHTFFNVLMPLFERNCEYSFSPTSDSTGIVSYRSNRDVAEELNTKVLGNELVCTLKHGVFSSMPGYLGLTDAKVSHTRCQHRGDSTCTTVIDSRGCQPLRSDTSLAV